MLANVGKGTKICSKCGVEKPISEFNKSSYCEDGFWIYCKSCVKVMNRENHKKHRTSTKEYKTRNWITEKSKEGHKYCLKCGQEKLLSEFSSNGGYLSGLESWCRNCKSENHSVRMNDPIYHERRRVSRSNFEKRKWRTDLVYRTKKSRRSRENFLLRKFGITIEEYEGILEKQDNKCCVCLVDQDEFYDKRHKMFAVDHDHKTGKVRGLLCDKCNRGLGLLSENVENLERAIIYIQKFSKGEQI